MTVWMYFETDNDSGYYGIKIFNNKEKAEAWKKSQMSAYGQIKEFKVN